MRTPATREDRHRRDAVDAQPERGAERHGAFERPADDNEDSAKRRQIVAGARRLFLSLGYDATSMGEIARASGVSKGTLYVYFKDKDKLFEAIVVEECTVHAEGVFNFDMDDPDVAATLTRVGTTYVKTLCVPERRSSLRAVIAVADRKPEVGRAFYETGLAKGVARLAAYLQANTAAGRLDIEDCELAAAQFIESCLATIFKPFLFNYSAAPAPERVEHVVRTAVRTFMAAYGRSPS
jgi:AcrR family transcriptional regulator